MRLNYLLGQMITRTFIVKKLRNFGIICQTMFLLLILPDRIFAQELGDILLGAKSGYTKPQGHYAAQLQDSFFFELFTAPLVKKFFMAEFGLSYVRYPLSESRNSYLNSLSLNAGPLFHLPIIPMLHIYLGISFELTYFQLLAREVQKEENTMKPGFAFKSGLLFPLSSFFAFRLGYQFNQNQLSGSAFSNHNFYGAVFYSFYFEKKSSLQKLPLPPLNPERKPKFENLYIDELYKKALFEFKNRNYQDARKIFEKILSLNNSHEASKNQLDIIKSFYKQYDQGLALIQKKEFFAAIPLLEKSGFYLAEAMVKLAEIRRELKKNNPGLLAAGIAAYEIKECEKSMNLLEKVLLMAPANNRAIIYFQKAVRCFKAMQKLK